MIPGWLGLVMLASGLAVGFGSYWLADWLERNDHGHCVRCGCPCPPGVDECWECAEMTSR